VTQLPIIAGFHPDPSVCAVDGTFYLANSTFEYAPGVPIHASTNFRDWTLIGHALHTPDQLSLVGAGPSGGIFAPTLRHHGGRFWMITTNVADAGGQVLVSAENAAGPWSEATRIPDIDGIDPDIAWDSDGRCLVTFASRAGIQQVEIDPETGALVSGFRPLWSGTGGKFPEGPHIFKRGEYWYLLIAEGGTERGHAVTIARGSSPIGPFEANPDNPILTRRGTSSAVQSTGHSDIVEIGNDEWAIVYLGVRPRGSSPEWHVLGRESFASEVRWIDGWPVVGNPISPPATPIVEHFRAGSPLAPTWIGVEEFPDRIVTTDDTGWTLSASDAGGRFIGRRQDRLYCSFQAHLDVDGEAAVAIRIDDKHQFRMELESGRLRSVLVVGGHRIELDERALPAGGDLVIRTMPLEGSPFDTTRGPDYIVGGLVQDGHFIETARVDGRYVSTEVAGGMTGRVLGVSVVSGTVTLTEFSYVGSDDWTDLIEILGS
jgi:xylan 1,4-beta-xylosidase